MYFDTARLMLAAPAVLLITAAGAGQPAPGPAAARMTITGRVLDPSGQPVPGAAVTVLVRSKLYDRTAVSGRPMAIGGFGDVAAHDGRCDGSGRFHIELPRTSSARHDGLTAAALAPGFGIGWVELDPDAERPDAEIALRPEQVIAGRAVDVQGQPARGAAIEVTALVHPVPAGITESLSHPDRLRHPPRDLAAWPRSTVSDDQGRFTVRGVSRGLRLAIRADDPRFDESIIILQTDEGPRDRAGPIPVLRVDPSPGARPITITLQPARTVTGRVTYADTGRPVSHAPIVLGAMQYRADAEGRFRAAGAQIRRDRFAIQAHPPEGAPYLAASRVVAWPKGAVEQTVDLALPRGAVVRGKVTEEGTGRPVAGAVVLVVPYRPPGRDAAGLAVPGVTDPDGTYRVAAPPGAGTLVVQGPDDDYVLHVFGGEGVLTSSAPGRTRFYAHAYRAVDLKPGAPDEEVDLALRRGAAVHGRVVGPDDRPIREARIFTRLIPLGSPMGGWRMWLYLPSLVVRARVRDGRFALHGLDPGSDEEVPAYFLDPVRKLGASAKFSGKSASSGPVTVRLEPCGSARARFVGPDGKPVARYTDPVSMVVTPGPPSPGNRAKEGPLLAEEAFLPQVDPVNYPYDFLTDAQGRATFPVLIPGATYRIVDRTAATGGEPAVRKEFTVKPGESLDLGDILVARPRRRD